MTGKLSKRQLCRKVAVGVARIPGGLGHLMALFTRHRGVGLRGEQMLRVSPNARIGRILVAKQVAWRR